MSTVPSSNWTIRRETQIKVFEAFLDDIIAGDPSITIQEWYGVPGIGKTELVRQLREMTQQRGLPCALIDFDPQRNGQVTRYGQQPVLFFGKILNDLKIEPLDDIERALDDLGHTVSNRNKAVTRVAEAFVNRIPNPKSGKPVILFFDKTERINREGLSWLVHPFIESLVLSDQCGIVCTGRGPQQFWQSPGLRAKQESRELYGFSIPEVEPFCSGDSVDRLFGLTQGHPMATKVVIDYLQTKKSQHIVAWEPLEQRLMAAISAEVIFGYILEDVPKLVQRVAPYLAVLRLLDASFLHDFLRHMQEYESQQKCRWLLTKIKVFTKYNSTRKAHCLKPTIRNLLLNHFRIQQSQEYYQAHTDALRIYRQWMAKNDAKWSQWVLESMYHEACLLRACSAEESIKPQLETSLRRYLADYENIEPDSDSRLQRYGSVAGDLGSDTDMKALVGPDVIGQLCAMLGA